MSVFDVAAFGAVGDGVADDREAIQAAITACALAGGGVVQLMTGTHRVTQTPTCAYCLSVPSHIVIEGRGRGATRVLLAANQEKWARPFSMSSVTDVTLRGFTIDGNAGNQAYQSEQQHGIFIDRGTRVLVEDVTCTNLWGDGVYWFGTAQRNLIRACWFENFYRVGVHAQAFEDCTITDCFFSSSTGQGGVKSEQDQDGTVAVGLTVNACQFAGGLDNFGVIVSGNSSAWRACRITVSGCQFHGLGQAIGIGVWSTAWAITGNQIDGCAQGITETNYALSYGYDAHSDVTIVGNSLRGIVDNGPDQWAISLSNTRNASVFANAITARLRGIRVMHSSGVGLGRNTIQMTQPNAMGMQCYRSPETSALGETIRMAGGSQSHGMYIADDPTYPGTPITVGECTVLGVTQYGIKREIYSSGAVAIRNFVATNAVISVG